MQIETFTQWTFSRSGTAHITLYSADKLQQLVPCYIPACREKYVACARKFPEIHSGQFPRDNTRKCRTCQKLPPARGVDNSDFVAKSRNQPTTCTYSVHKSTNAFDCQLSSLMRQKQKIWKQNMTFDWHFRKQPYPFPISADRIMSPSEDLPE